MGGASRFTMFLTTPSPFPSLLRLARRSLPSSSSSSLFPLYTPSPTTHPQLLLVRPLQPKATIHTQTTTTNQDNNRDSLAFPPDSTPPAAAHAWPEWSALVDSLSSRGYFDSPAREILPDDAFAAHEALSEEFVRASGACLGFARDRTDLMGLLSRSDIGVVVETGTPFLFKSALDTTRRMRAFLGNGAHNEFDTNKAHTVDLMKYLLSYASNPTVSPEKSNLHAEGLIESAIRNLLSELTRLGFGIPPPESCASVQNQFIGRYGQTTGPLGQNTEMKRGDWICPRCTFMNFARNVKCLKCEEARPKRELTGREWECPRCDFFNYGRNPLCIRCDCKRPVDPLFGITDSSPVSGHGSGLYSNKPDIESRLAINEEKAQRWFSKISKLEGASDLSNAAADEDFPEIMPLRKGVNRFVVSTRKTPLERRLANSQFQRDAANTRSSEILDGDGQNAETASSPSVSRSTSQTKGSHSNYVPFVPLPKVMFAKNPEKIEADERVVTDTTHDGSSKASEQTSTVPVKSETGKSGDSLNLTEQASNEVEKSESWLKKLSDLHGAAGLESESPDDFPDIMPMRKGENRFVVSKKNSRSLSSPMYKRKMAMEQTSNSTNFVPFVPFPPDYFAKRDNQPPHGADLTVKATGKTSSDSDSSDVQNPDNLQTSTGVLNSQSSGENLNERKNRDTDGSAIRGNPTLNSLNSQSSDKEDSWSMGFSGKESGIESTDLSSGNERKHITLMSPVGGDPTQSSFDSDSNKQDGMSSGFSGKERGIESENLTGSSSRLSESKSFRSGWTGKSLEGSAVQEPDPLDMSEEAKAQRWFRRVAQIKDISELSQIPDEDFPSIMPMRKGVNRFVVSKRKTPLERRLTSPQYRRNLPVVNSDPFKKDNENS